MKQKIGNIAAVVLILVVLTVTDGCSLKTSIAQSVINTQSSQIAEQPALSGGIR